MIRLPTKLFSHLLLTLVPCSLACAETWECESPNDGLPQILSIDFDGNVINALSYSSMAPAPDGTKTVCSLEAKRGDGASSWTENSKGVTVKSSNWFGQSDQIRITRNSDTVSLDITAAASNCGHSTLLGSKISISKGKKNCHGIEME